MNEVIVRRILQASGLLPLRVHPPQKGYRNQSWPVELRDGRLLNVIFYKDEPTILDRIRAANNVSDFAAEKGLPTRRTVGRVITLKTNKTIRYAAIYTYLPGGTIPWEAYTMGHLKSLGAAMSNLHAVLQNYAGSLPSVTVEYRAITVRMARYFARTDVREAMQRKLGFIVAVPPHFTRLLDIAGQLPQQQALHMDFVRGNILFEDFDVSGVLDFEKTGRGHRSFDVARTLAFLLVDCKYKTTDKIRKYFLRSGYNKRGAVTFRDATLNIGGQRRSLLESLVDLFLLYDLYKFLRHNPYESLALNEHFVRTRDLLQQRQVIAYNEMKESEGTDGNILEKAADLAE